MDKHSSNDIDMEGYVQLVSDNNAAYNIYHGKFGNGHYFVTGIRIFIKPGMNILTKLKIAWQVTKLIFNDKNDGKNNNV